MLKIHFGPYPLFSHFVEFQLGVKLPFVSIGLVQVLSYGVTFPSLLPLLSIHYSKVIFTQILGSLPLYLKFAPLILLILLKFILDFMVQHPFMILLESAHMVLNIQLRQVNVFHIHLKSFIMLLLIKFNPQIIVMFGFEHRIPHCRFLIHFLFKLGISENGFTHFF